MLLITHAGLTVNLAHVAYITWRKEESPSQPPARNPQEVPVRVLLVLPSGDSVVAARNISPAAARFLREAVTHAWAEGTALTDVRNLLAHHAEGAYIAAEAGQTSAEAN